MQNTIETIEGAEAVIAEQISNIPDELVTILRSDTFRPAVKTILQSHNISEDKSTTLENEVALVLLAFQKYQDLKSNIETALNISAEQAASIEQEIMKTFISNDTRSLLDLWYEAQSESTPQTDIPTQQPATPQTDTPKAENSPMNTAPAAVPTPTASTAQAPEPVAAPAAPAVPQYQKPLTNVPRYGEGDPYRASIDD